nr:hypothetical protein [Gordonia polyisoprenivorans]
MQDIRAGGAEVVAASSVSLKGLRVAVVGRPVDLDGDAMHGEGEVDLVGRCWMTRNPAGDAVCGEDVDRYAFGI